MKNSTIPNGNGTTSNRLSSLGDDLTSGSLPAWPNKETALVFAEILYVAVMDDDPDSVLETDRSPEAHARRLAKHFDAAHWVEHGTDELNGLPITRAAFELLLANVDWRAIADHLAAFGKATAD
jgi:hypothetical protein